MHHFNYLRQDFGICFRLLIFFVLGASAWAQPAVFYDLAQKPPATSPLTRIHGSVGFGIFGLPVAGPSDVDGDGNADFAIGFMRASPLGRSLAGEVNLIFGSGHLGEVIDTALNIPRILRFAGESISEAAGNEIWLGDVNGDGLADLLIGRQNHTPSPERIGAGALSIVLGTPRLRELATSLQYLDLSNPPASIQVFTVLGRMRGDRMGMWMRTGDIDGDGIDDIIVGADQEDVSGTNSGATYVIRGGDHLSGTAIVDLNDVEGTALEGHLARLIPPPNSNGFHSGATCFIADLDGNGKGEALTAAALERSGAAIQPNGATTSQARGGAPRGRLYIAWDDNFTRDPWPLDFELNLGDLPGGQTTISGGPGNGIFGEEIIGGNDFNGNGLADLFVGDFRSDETGFNLFSSGSGYVLYDVAQLKGQAFSINAPPVGLVVSTIAGPSRGAIGADTATAADYDGDGFDDLAFGSPHHRPQGRISAGSIHVFFGQADPWPAFMSTVPGQIPSPSEVRMTEIQGARGSVVGDAGDTLAYSATSGDADGDGFADLLSNEMIGRGLAPNTPDVGNLIIISGPDIARRSMLDFAQIGNGDDFFSRLQLTNPYANLTLTANARFQDDNGDPLPLPIQMEGNAPAGFQISSEVELEIPPRGTVSIRTDGAGDVVSGTVRVSSNGTLGGLVFFNFSGIGLAGIPASQRLSSFMIPVRREGTTLSTGIAVANLGNEQADLALILNDADGQKVGGDLPPIMISLPAGGHVARFFDELFGELVPENFVGTLVVTCDSCTLAAVALELGTAPGNFTAVPVIELPTP